MTLAIAGEFDLAAAQPTQALLHELEAAGPRAIVMDLQAVTFLDSSGIKVLLDAHKRSFGTRAFAVLRVSQPAHRALTMVGMDEHISLISSLDELAEELELDTESVDGAVEAAG